jgi:outer membrane lipoprotein SlyB
LSVNGRMVDATTADVSQASASRGARTAKVVGGTTALGAIIGAIAGGGKGAAIGAASGAAVGGTAQAVTKGQVVKIPPETRLTFTLQQPIQL